ncbi:MAG: non-hydrolyzing UDP-N-acetylglucosamine 2-epimerase [Leptospirillia bacterium]
MSNPIRRILFVFGTRPETIKMAPVIDAVRAAPGLEARVCVTAQHREMIDPLLAWFHINPDHDLNLMQPGQTLPDLTGRVLTAMDRVLEEEAPDVVVVQGDTTTTMAASLAAYYRKVAVAHVEAGLRTGDRYAPFPEEGNRRITGVLTDVHFPPTERAKNSLLAEGICADSVHVTGNTVVDALLATADRIDREDHPAAAAAREQVAGWTKNGGRLVLVTGHRRESFGEGFKNICAAIAELARAFPNDAFVYPVHLNPNVQAPVRETLSELANVHLIEPLDYLPFVVMMRAAHLILTDSGGVQEEAPTFGVPVLVMREVTERREGIDAGVVALVGTDRARIVEAAGRLLNDAAAHAAMSGKDNPYGDGKAAGRIARALTDFLNHD